MKTSILVSSRVSSRSSSNVNVGMRFNGKRTSVDGRGVLFLYCKYGWKRMAFPATNVRIETGPAGLITKNCHLDAALESSHQGTGHFAMQLHEFTSIRHPNGRDRAGTAQVALPCRAKQAALFKVAAAVVITIEIFTFRPSGCFHIASANSRSFEPAGGVDYTRVKYSPVRVSTRMVSPSLTKFGHCTSKPVSTLTFLVTPVAVSPRTATSA